NFIYLLLKRLLLFQHLAYQLAQQLQKDISQQVRNDGNLLYNLLLENYEWQYLEELIILLQPFAQSIIFIGDSHYPTLGIMYLTIQKLFNHLNTVKLATFEVQE
ncbi:4042_t:CDS:1, partial [Dentiscutata erythropus]